MTSPVDRRAMWLAVLSLVHLLHSTQGGVIIDTKFDRYQHGCDEDFWPVDSNCDPMFTFCMDRPNSQWDSVQPKDCYYAVTPESSHYQDKSDILFTGDLIGGKIANPWIVRKGTLMDKSVVLKVRVRDDDTAGGDDHMVTMAKLITDMELYKNKQAATYNNYVIRKSHHVLYFKMRMYCETNYYGDSCWVYCNANEGNYKCEETTGKKLCTTGWEGSNCDVDINECEQSICDRGKCENLDGGYYCHCPPFYTGLKCAEEEDPCKGAPCENNGVCTVKRDPLGYNCKCTGPWSGGLCDVWVDPCNTDPCRNGGECKNIGLQTDEFWCNCTEKFNGTFCENKIEPATNPTTNPTTKPTTKPTTNSTTNPTTNPTTSPTTYPTGNPTTNITTNPTTNPATNPTTNPTTMETTYPTGNPTTNPATKPTTNPATNPTTNPTTYPATNPTTNPTGNPTTNPNPATNPTTNPATNLTTNPTTNPATNPTSSTTTNPTTNLTSSTTTNTTMNTTTNPDPIVPGKNPNTGNAQGKPEKYQGSGDSGGFEAWMAAVICGAILIPAIILVVCVVVRRKRKRKHDDLETTLSQANSNPEIRSGNENLAFQNVMYNDIHRRSENGDGIIRGLPTTPTDDVDFDMIKPVFSPATHEDEGATGGYSSLDNDGYEKPGKLVETLKGEILHSQSERAQANPYSDFSKISSLRHPSQDDDEPHYQDLDEVGAAIKDLNDTLDDDGVDEEDQSADLANGKLSLTPMSATNDIVDTSDPLSNPLLFKGFAGLQQESSTDAPAFNPYSETPSNTPKNSIRQHEPYTDVPINTPKNSLKQEKPEKNPPLPPARINSLPLGSPKLEEEIEYTMPNKDKPMPYKEGPYADVPLNGLKTKDPFADDVFVEDERFDADLPNPGSAVYDNKYPQRGSSTMGSHYDSPRTSLGKSAPPPPLPSSESPGLTRYSLDKPTPYDNVNLSDDTRSLDDLPDPPPPPGRGDSLDGDAPDSLRNGQDFEDDVGEGAVEETDKDTAQLTPHLRDQALFLENSMFSKED